MVTLGASGLIAAYVLIAILLLSILIYSSWNWWVKTTLIIITSGFYIVTYLSYPLLMGWPTEAELPERFRLVSTAIQEPDKLTGSEGNIYLWVTDMRSDPSIAKPRSHQLPYSDDLHKKVIEANQKMRKGILQLGQLEDEENAVRVSASDNTRLGLESVKIDFYDLPDPLFPEK